MAHGPRLWKTTQPEAHERGVVLTPLPSLPFPSPKRLVACGGLAQPFSSVYISPAPSTHTHPRADTQACTWGLSSPSRPLCVTPAALAVLRGFVTHCQDSPAGDGEGTGHCRLCWQHRESCLFSDTLTTGRRSAKAANRCYHCSRLLIDFNYTHIRFLVLLSRCRRLYRTVDNVYPLDIFYWVLFVCLDWFF